MNSIKITENLGEEHTSVKEMTKNSMLLYPLGRLDSENSLSSRFSESQVLEPFCNLRYLR